MTSRPEPAARPAPTDTALLLREFLRAPTTVATVTASSDRLVAAMLAPLPRGGRPTVVELGAGTGRLTAALAKRPIGRHLAVELNPVLAKRLADRHPGVDVVCADAAELPEILRRYGYGPVDMVASLLPWVAYRHAPIPRLVADALDRDGVFTQVVLSALRRLPPARRQAQQVREAFGDVRLSPVVWRNLPPARVRVARHPDML
jgi:phosphatidylethanolamine/phosphatidyl-N-methylethanolamine N-methyltransferase